MIDQRIRPRLERVATRFRRLRFLASLSIGWAALAVVGAACLGLNLGAGWYSQWTVPALIGSALIVPLVCRWVSRRSARDLHGIAERIESEHPELRSRLLAAIEQEPELPDGQFGFLQESVIREALAHGKCYDWLFTVSRNRLFRFQASSLVSLAALTVVMTGLIQYGMSPAAPSSQKEDAVHRISAGIDYQVSIEPGDTEVERGTSLLVLARFDGELPPQVTLAYKDDTGKTQQMPMSRSLDDPLFAGRIAAVDRELTYRVEYADQQTEWYHVSTFEHPELRRADAKLLFPEYTSLDEKIVEDVRRITAVEGTRLTLTFQLNKPVAEGHLVGEDEKAVPLTADKSDKPNTYVAQMTLEQSRRFKLHLADDRDRANKYPPEFVINVTRNQPPDLKLARPSRDVQVSPLEELRLKASAWDDYGLSSYGVTYSLAGQAPQDLALGHSAAAKQRHDLDHLVAFETLEAQPDQLLSYHFWAEDMAPDGKPRRTFSDMFFAEVRHFEEIYRQGEPPPGGSEQQSEQQQGENENNARNADQLAEVQKQIVSATWKLIRREIGEKPTAKFAADSILLKESQQAALQKVDELAEKVEDAESMGHVEDVKTHMNQALKHLTEASDGPATPALKPALAAEQSAYQALLKLRAREHRVMRANQQQQPGQSSSTRNASSRFQQQLDQLELKDSENRYETERSAAQQQQETEEQREARQVLNRLRELAQRQEDLNKRMKELQSELQEAKTEEEREEIRRQLKRLRDEEQQILRDTDELKNRMEEPQNQERMAQDRQQLEQTRENMRRASEALEKGMATQAAASGTRAERELKELRDEFRKKTSRRFSEEMRQMRDDARQLAENEQQLADKLTELRKPKEKSLRESGRRENVEEGLDDQRRDLDGLLDRMESTIQEADQSEPLLSQQLYDTLRETRQGPLNDAWDATRQLLRRGFLDDAQRTERIARQEINELQQGIESAAESVLGDEAEALRRALSEVKELQEQLDQEIARADPQSPRNQAREGDRPPDQSQDGRQPYENNQQPDGDRQQQENAQQSSDGRGRGTRKQDETEPRDGQRQPPGDATQPSDRQQESSDRPGQNDGQQPGEQRRQPTEAQPTQDRQPGSPDPSGQRQTQGGATTDGLGEFERFLDDRARLRGPLTGDGFRDWSDRLRDVEEMIDDSELRADAARIRERARAVRIDLKRHSKEPNWDLVRMSISKPLVELQQRIAEKLLRRQSEDALVPIDRDPVPPEFAEQVRKYYERLGSGR